MLGFILFFECGLYLFYIFFWSCRINSARIRTMKRILYFYENTLIENAGLKAGWRPRRPTWSRVGLDRDEVPWIWLRRWGYRRRIAWSRSALSSHRRQREKLRSCGSSAVSTDVFIPTPCCRLLGLDRDEMSSVALLNLEWRNGVFFLRRKGGGPILVTSWSADRKLVTYS